MRPPRIPLPVRALLRVYPRSFRDRYRPEYEAFLITQRSELGGGRLRGAAFWARQALDIVARGMKERLGGGAPGSGGTGTGVPGARRGFAVGALKDLQVAIRSLRRDPVYVAVSATALALGIGGATATFTVVDQLLLRPLPYPAPGELVQMYRTSTEEPGRLGDLSWADFDDIRAAVSAVELAAYHEVTYVVLEGGAPTRELGAAVTHRLFPVLGVEPLLGRGFTPEEDVFEGPRVAILSHGLWTDRFGADPGVLGRTIQLGEEPHTVVGVMPQGFSYPSRQERFWTPLHEDEILVRAGIDRGARGLHYLSVVGRLETGRSVAAGTDAVRSAARAVDETNRGEEADRWSVSLMPLDEYRQRDVPDALLLFLGASILVLAIACANVAGVTLSRGIARSREFAVRAAIGGRRAHAMRLVLLESLVLGALGGTLALLLAHGLLDTVTGLVQESRAGPGRLGLDGRVLAVSAGATAVTALLAGAVPALRAGRADPAAAMSLSDRSGNGGPSRQRLQRALLITQMVLSVVLLTGAGLLLRSFANLKSQPLGFRPEGIVTAALELPEDRYADDESRVAFYRELYASLEAVPGITRATATYSLPFSGTFTRTSVLLEGEDPDDDTREPRWARSVIVEPGYQEAMSVPLDRGRPLAHTDGPDAPRVAVINDVMARTFWPGEDPIGKVFRFGGSLSGSVDSLERRYFEHDITVVGVAGSERREELAEDRMPEFYVPYAQMAWASMSLIVRTDLPTEQVVPQIRDVVARHDPTLALDQVATLVEIVDRSTSQERLRSVVSGLFAAVAALLTMVGVYGVTSFGVSQRFREIGIRMALGARGHEVRRTVLASGLRTTAVALALGLPLAVVASRLVTSLLFATSPVDLATYVAVVVLVVLTTVVSCWLPARRASAVDPARVMGTD